MYKKDAFIAGIFAVATIILLLVSMGALDFAKGQGGTAWAALIVGGAGVGYIWKTAFDKVVRNFAAISLAVIAIIPLIVFWSH